MNQTSITENTKIEYKNGGILFTPPDLILDVGEVLTAEKIQRIGKAITSLIQEEREKIKNDLDEIGRRHLIELNDSTMRVAEKLYAYIGEQKDYFDNILKL